MTVSNHGSTELAASPEPGDELNPDDPLAEDKTPALDITLDETKRILADLVNLSAPGNSLAATAPAGKKPAGSGQSQTGEGRN